MLSILVKAVITIEARTAIIATATIISISVRPTFNFRVFIMLPHLERGKNAAI
jgi:predicted cupin superfamily sugar epimerase